MPKVAPELVDLLQALFKQDELSRVLEREDWSVELVKHLSPVEHTTPDAWFHGVVRLVVQRDEVPELLAMVRRLRPKRSAEIDAVETLAVLPDVPSPRLASPPPRASTATAMPRAVAPPPRPKPAPVNTRPAPQGWRAAKARVAVLAVHAELAECSKRAAAVLSGLRSQVAEVIEVDLADQAAMARADGCLLRLVLLGGCTAGAEGAALIRALLAEGDRTLLATQDPLPNEVHRRFRADRDLRLELLDLVAQPLAFTNAGDLSCLRDPLAARLATLLPAPPQGNVVLELWERWYLDSQARSWEEGRAGGLRAMSPRCRLDRAPLYVSLHAQVWGRESDRKPTFLDERISDPRLQHIVVVGEAGTGKTVLLQHIAWSLSCAHRSDPLPDEQHLDLDALARGQASPPVPVLVEARQLSAEIVAQGRSGAVERLLSRAFCADQAPAERRPPPGAVAAGLDRGRYLLLVDALDEVPGQKAREDVLDLLKGLPEVSRCRVVLCTRPTAHTAVSIPRPYMRIDIAPLDDERRGALLARWRAVQGLDEEATRALQRALTGLGARFGGEGTGRSPLDNPLLLTAVLLVHLEQRRLPDNLADLYERMVRHLCDRRPDDPEAREDERDRTSAERRELLMAVGFALQEAGSTALPVDRLAERLVAEGRARDRAEARAALDRLSVSTGVIRFEAEGGEQVVRPWHRTFQEYLAACSLAGRKGSEAEMVASLARELPDGPAPLLDPAWEGCLRFATGAMGQTGGARARGYVEALLAEAARDPAPMREGRLLGLAAGGVAEYEREYFRDGPLRAELPRRVEERFLASDGAWPWRDRLLALTALGRLGDPRLPDPRESSAGWVKVPGRDGSLLRLWPVTVAEYSAFVEDQGFRDPRWWMESEPGEPSRWDDQHNVRNAPVVGVSWYDARAFSRWANARWARPDARGSFDLPDSGEWEAAALQRGGPYPWGSADPGNGDTARANFRWSDDAPRTKTPVGLFRRAADGPHLDLAGNVWEWCASGWQADKPCHLDGKVDDNPRVLRGGSWFNDASRLLAENRRWNHPSFRNGSVGFRVVFRALPAFGIEPG